MKYLGFSEGLEKTIHCRTIEEKGQNKYDELTVLGSSLDNNHKLKVIETQ